MPDQPPRKIVRLTPAGRGAVATLLVEGPGAADAVQRGFQAAGGRPLASYPPGRLVFGRFDFGASSREEVVVHLRSPESVELCCHGGHAAVAALEKALVQEGGVAAAWRAWAAEQHADPIAAAARVALAEARTERAAMVLLDQFHGALREAIESIRQQLDRRQKALAAEQLETLLGRAPIGRHLVEPWRVMLVGPPNVGKSSLINTLVGYQRAIVHPTPGTTRDIVSAATAVDGWPVELSDTAGLHSAGRSAVSAVRSRARRPTRGEELEQAGIALAQEKLADADLVILVFDLSRPWSAIEAALSASCPAAMVVHNKRDLPEAPGPRPAGLRTSALRGEGIDELLRAMSERLVPEPPPPGAAVPFTAEQIDRLGSATEALARDDPSAAQKMLAEI